MVHDTVKPAMETETTVLKQKPNNDKDNGDNVHSTQRVIIDLTAKRAASTPVKGCKSEGKLLPGLDIELMEDSDSESENDVPTFFIYDLNERLSLWISDAENYTYKMAEEYSLVEKLEGISLSDDVKLEHAPETSSIYGILQWKMSEYGSIKHMSTDLFSYALKHGTAC